ncbi:NAD(P)-dependent alcohol dehydrogenase [Bacillus sp. HMF5848]|uniref:NAD(P)-dependent alcohol dehydrogenase n=1 Tax=Bacillus sp. HMF5848 TaxID=2495421 RepID=UPI000F7B6D9B|nr:NAD(P)-dependent alcohol dehydrogenase [Bacillus sp. HMF5848]RSK26578.1 NAD(P)-dependent alcohol dehydrogenase [Bacillus sp. HMF5848]
MAVQNMKGVIIEEYGNKEVLKYISNLSLPTIADNQVLIKNDAASINPLDWKIRKGELRWVTGKKFPIILGHDVSGTIVKVGRCVKRFKPGDPVFCMIDANIKPSLHGFAKSGSFADYCVTREDTLAIRPSSITPTDAAAVPLAALTAYKAIIKKGKLQSGQKILINGASGGVGTFAVQLARWKGAHVTAVCSRPNFDMVSSLGADQMIDYTKRNFLKSQMKYDVIFDVIANSSFGKCKHILKDDGVYISNIANPTTIIGDFLFPIKKRFISKKRHTFNWVKPNGQHLEQIGELIEKKELTPIVDRIYPLSHIQEAHTYCESNRTRGKVVLSMR